MPVLSLEKCYKNLKCIKETPGILLLKNMNIVALKPSIENLLFLILLVIYSCLFVNKGL